MWGLLTCEIALWRFGTPPELQLPKGELTWECESSFSHSSWPMPLRPFCLGHELKARVVTMTFTPSCTCPLNQVKALKPSWLMGKTKSLKASSNIYSVIHWLDIFGPIISKLVHELTLNPLLLLHHVVHIPKYSLFELRYKHQWWT